MSSKTATILWSLPAIFGAGWWLSVMLGAQWVHPQIYKMLLGVGALTSSVGFVMAMRPHRVGSKLVAVSLALVNLFWLLMVLVVLLFISGFSGSLPSGR